MTIHKSRMTNDERDYASFITQSLLLPESNYVQ
jgi:hypothetical protein